jgi:hypothetical protein
VLSPTTDDPDEDTRDPDEDTKDPDADAETMDSEEPARAGVEKGEAEKSASLPRLLPYMSGNLPRLAGSQAPAPQQSSKSEPSTDSGATRTSASATASATASVTASATASATASSTSMDDCA